MRVTRTNEHMELAVSQLSRPRLAERLSPRGAAAWTGAFVLVLYLALQGGGYDPIVRGEVGIAVVWIVLLGALVGALRPARIAPLGLAALGLLGLFAGWTAFGATWSESVERSLLEGGRVATYLGVLAVVMATVTPDLRRTVLNGVMAAVVSVAALAVLSRLHPAWFPHQPTAEFLPGARGRLSYPLNYWNALAALAAFGAPLVLAVAFSARTLAGQAAAAAAVPLLALCGYLTLSRGGALAALVGLAVFLALAPNRLPKLATLALCGSGAALLIAGAHQRPAVEEALTGAAAREQGDGLLAMVVVVCGGMALLQVAISLVIRHVLRPERTTIDRGVSVAGLIAALLVAFTVAIAAGAPATLSQRWEDFKRPSLELSADAASRSARFGSTSGHGRYQFWKSAVDAGREHAVRGVGPGTFEYWWASNASFYSFVRDAHSLYFETLAELGIVGLALLGIFMFVVLGGGALRTMSTRSPSERVLLAGATAACAAFATSAAVDWVWEVAVLPIAFLVTAGVLLAPSLDRRTASRRADLAGRTSLALGAAGALALISVSVAGSSALRESRRDVRGANLTGAVANARTAQSVQPYAALPYLQEALVLERAGDLDAAVAKARRATREEPVNWRNWLVLSRIEAKRDRPGAAISAFRRARSLNRRSPIFAPPAKEPG